ncbi:hypothetical protein [Candidatus Hepatobacter penaei]|uniref:hypothetical protein n=1 Tax=Candidatus Hepatobacter penaei TaxID=1274402 RepID=UPI0004F31789|nr:hypothetical protein [Candidatus Hepatobacter penaei]
MRKHTFLMTALISLSLYSNHALAQNKNNPLDETAIKTLAAKPYQMACEIIDANAKKNTPHNPTALMDKVRRAGKTDKEKSVAECLFAYAVTRSEEINLFIKNEDLHLHLSQKGIWFSLNADSLQQKKVIQALQPILKKGALKGLVRNKKTFLGLRIRRSPQKREGDHIAYNDLPKAMAVFLHFAQVGKNEQLTFEEKLSIGKYMYSFKEENLPNDAAWRNICTRPTNEGIFSKDSTNATPEKIQGMLRDQRGGNQKTPDQNTALENVKDALVFMQALRNLERNGAIQ